MIEAERARCAQRHAEALEALARRASARGDTCAAVSWWRRLVDTEPLRDDYVMGFMGALADAGELSGALAYARRYARLVRQELDVDVSPALLRFVDALPARARTAMSARSLVLDTSGLARKRGGRHRDLPNASARAI
jgi:DNA-binding SARP family transcriptional activator